MDLLDPETKKFKDDNDGNNSFRGEKLPRGYKVYASETQKLENGQVINETTLGQTLYWSCGRDWRKGTVIAKGYNPKF